MLSTKDVFKKELFGPELGATLEIGIIVGDICFGGKCEGDCKGDIIGSVDSLGWIDVCIEGCVDGCTKGCIVGSREGAVNGW